MNSVDIGIVSSLFAIAVTVFSLVYKLGKAVSAIEKNTETANEILARFEKISLKVDTLAETQSALIARIDYLEKNNG